MPRSPKLATSNRASVSKSAEGTDALRMKEAEAAMEQAKKRRKLGEQRLRGVASSAADPSAAAATRPAKTLTVPHSPAFAASRRSAAPSRSSSVDSLHTRWV